MHDMGFLPSLYGGIDYQRFDANVISSGDYFDWRMPRGARCVYFLIVNGGTSGSSGFAATSGAAGSGGGGGTGAIVRCIAPAFVVPRRLSIQVGTGAVATTAAGAAGNQVTRNTALYVPANSGALSQVMFCSNGAVAGAATAAAGGTGGASGGISTGFHAIPFLATGNAGVAGNITGVGTNGTAGIITAGGGAAGAGCAATYAAANGGITTMHSAIDGYIHRTTAGVGATTGGTNGSDGYTYWYNDGLMFQSLGGAGGGNASTGKAGNGGKGGIGSGGGGGGAASGTGGTAGFGGAGGDGVVVIACW